MKTKKIIFIINAITIVLVTMLSMNYCLANSIKPGDLKEEGITKGVSVLKTNGGIIIGWIQFLGTAISIAMIVILGIKYMTASPEGKADYKGTMIPYLVGAILLFAATNIATAIYDVIAGIK